MGLHRVGQTLVLDGNLGEVLVPTNKVPVPGAPPPAQATTNPPRQHGGGGTSSRSRSSTTSDAAMVRDDDGMGGTRVGRSAKESRWVMVGKGGKPQRHAGGGWQEDEDEEKTGTTTSTGESGRGRACASETRRGGGAMQQKQCNGAGRGWENNTRRSGSDSKSADGEGEWALHQGSWPALGSSSEAAAPGDGIMSIVPSRPRGGSFGRTRPPEPAGFWRAFQWELAGMRLMLGSSLQVMLMRCVCRTQRWRLGACLLLKFDLNLVPCRPPGRRIYCGCKQLGTWKMVFVHPKARSVLDMTPTYRAPCRLALVGDCDNGKSAGWLASASPR